MAIPINVFGNYRNNKIAGIKYYSKGNFQVNFSLHKAVLTASAPVFSHDIAQQFLVFVH